MLTKHPLYQLSYKGVRSTGLEPALTGDSDRRLYRMLGYEREAVARCCPGRARLTRAGAALAARRRDCAGP